MYRPRVQPVAYLRGGGEIRKAPKGGYVSQVPLYSALGGAENDLIKRIIAQPFGKYWSEIREKLKLVCEML